MSLLAGAIKAAKSVSKAMDSSKSNSPNGRDKKTSSVSAPAVTNKNHYSNTGDSFGTAVKQDLKNQGLSTTRNDGGGFAYADKYGFTHVTNDYETAMTYSKDGKVYDHQGDFSGGYAKNKDGGREYLAGIQGSTNFGNYNNVIDDKNKTPDSINYNKYNIADIQKLLGGSNGLSSPTTKPAVQQSNQQAQGQYAYQNYDMYGNYLGTTYGPSGSSNSMPGASYVKAPNGQTYSTGKWGNANQNQQQNQQNQYNPYVSAQNPQYMNPQDFFMKPTTINIPSSNIGGSGGSAPSNIPSQNNAGTTPG